MWIEICTPIITSFWVLKVTSHTEVWIEILRFWYKHIALFMSPPIRRCGLKLKKCCLVSKISASHLPYGGVDWNFTWFNTCCYSIRRSPPIRRCGLKLELVDLQYLLWLVTSHTEVWIEILSHVTINPCPHSHLPYGGVDWNIFSKFSPPLLLLSPPIRRCGLKLKI